MIALAEAVIPIIRLLVAVATRSGTPMITCIVGTLMRPPPIPRRADASPAPRLPTIPQRKRWTRYPGPESDATKSAVELGRAAVAAFGPSVSCGSTVTAAEVISATGVAADGARTGCFVAASRRLAIVRAV